MRTLGRWLYVPTLAAALLFAWADSVDASKSRSTKSRSTKARSTKSRASKKVSRAQKASRGKASRNRAAKGKSRSRKEKLSRRGKRGRERQASRGRRSHRYARSRRQQYEPQEAVAPAALKPAASGIPTERVIEIQNALVKAGYLDGPASGQYNDQTIEAMKQFQADNALPQTGLPSAHALKKLGVSKRSNDGYAIPVKSDKKSSAQGQSGASPEM